MSSSKWSSHPTQLSSVSGQVVVLYSQSGVVVVAGPTQIYCFFTRAQVWGEGECSIRVGEEVMINARMVPPPHRLEMVPYLATTVWREGCHLPSALSLRLLSPHTADELQHYQATVPGLVGLLPDNIEDSRGGVEVDRLGSSLVMQGIISMHGVREKERVASKADKSMRAKRDQHPEIETQKKVEPEKKKKRFKSSSSEDEPIKHLDCLHKINDIIAELEKKVATDPPKSTKPLRPDPPAQPEEISYPQPGVAYSLNRPTSPHNIGFPNPNKLSTAPAWLGLTVAPGSVSTAINPISNPLVPTLEQQAVISDMSEEEDQSPIKKSIFTDIFDHDDRPMSPENNTPPMVASSAAGKSDTRGGLGARLSNILQDRILNKTRVRESGIRRRNEKVNDNSRDKTTSQSRSKSREKIKDRNRNSRRTRSRSSSQDKNKGNRRQSRKNSRSRSRKIIKDRSRSRYSGKRSSKKRNSRSSSRNSDKRSSMKKGNSRTPPQTKKGKEKRSRKQSRSASNENRSKKRSPFTKSKRSKLVDKSADSKAKTKGRSCSQRLENKKSIKKKRNSRSRSRNSDKRSSMKKGNSRTPPPTKKVKEKRSRQRSRSASTENRSKKSKISLSTKRNRSKSVERNTDSKAKTKRRSCSLKLEEKRSRSDSRHMHLRKKKDHEQESNKGEIYHSISKKNRKRSKDRKSRKERSERSGSMSKERTQREKGRRKLENNIEDKRDDNDDLRNYIEKLKRKDSPEHEKDHLNRNTTKSDNDTDASEEEMIIRKRRLNRSKFLAAFKDENLEVQEINSNETEAGQIDAENIPIAFFEQPTETLEGHDVKNSPVVFFDAEVLHDGSNTHVLQLGAHATVLEKSFTFFKYMQTNLLQGDQLEQLTLDAKFELMDCLRLKTSKFDVTHSGKLNLYFKHPELGSISSEKERDVLLSFISFLKSLKSGHPVILVTHRKDTVLPALFSLLTKHDLLAQFSPLVVHCCELVHLAWELHMDHLWQGARYPGLRSVAEFVDRDLQWDDGYLPCDKISYLLACLVGKMREEHKLEKLDRFVEQCGGVGVMDYMTAKYNLVQSASGSRAGVDRPDHVEVVRGSDQWGRKMRIELKWKENTNYTEVRNNRRTPIPEPDSVLDDGEHHVRILKPEESKQFSIKSSDSVISWSDKSFNTFLPPGVSKISPLSTINLLLRIPALKPRISELLGVSVLVQQNPEFTHCRILKSTQILTQPKNSMFPIVEAMFENTSKEEVSLDSKIINFAVANIKLDSQYEP